MNMFIATVNCAAVGILVLPLAIDQTELFPTGEVPSVEAQCPNYCKGDFPVSPNRKYAQANDRPTSCVIGSVIPACGA